MFYRSFGLVGISVCSLFSTPQTGLADAAADLAAGRAALASGDFDKALSLLTAASHDLPASVEARLAVAECLLKLGQTDKALVEYTAVLKLSPDHAVAKKIIAGLTASRQSFDEKLAIAKAFLDVGAFQPAERLLARAVQEPESEARQSEARLLLIRARLWLNGYEPVLEDAVRLMQLPEYAPRARAAAALALVCQHPDHAPRAAELLAGLPADRATLGKEWSSLADLAADLLALRDSDQVAGVSSRLAQHLSAIPASPFRDQMLNRAYGRVVEVANERLGRGETASVVAILWPAVSGAPLPDDNAELVPIELRSGWLEHNVNRIEQWHTVARLLAMAGRQDASRPKQDSTLAPIWLAAEVARQSPPVPARIDVMLQIAHDLSSLSRPSPERKPGAPLSRADVVQLAVLRSTGPLAANDAQRNRQVELLAGYVARHAAADDVETALKQLVELDPAKLPAPGQRLKLHPAFDDLPPGDAHQRLFLELGTHFSALATKKFQENASLLKPQANAEPNAFAIATLNLYGQAAAIYPNLNLSPQLDAVLQPLIGAESWSATSALSEHFYAHLSGDAGRWAAIRLRLLQGAATEDKTLAANRKLGDKLPETVQRALADLLALVQANPSLRQRQTVIQTATPLVQRYVSLERLDLAAAVIASLADAEGAALADWGGWERIQLLDRQAARVVALTTPTLGPNARLSLNEFHAAELSRLTEFVSKFPKSSLLGPVVERVVQISNLYQTHRSFAVAEQVLRDFLKAHPQRSFARRLEFAIVQSALARARTAFDEVKDRPAPPVRLSEEFTAAIDAVAKFLELHPTGEFVPEAEAELLSIARTYGQVGAWPVAREVLARFAAAVPDFHSPARLEFLKAATYLGELDRAYGLSLLTAPPQPRASFATPDAIAATAKDALNGDVSAFGNARFATATSRPAEADGTKVADAKSEAGELSGFRAGGGGAFGAVPGATAPTGGPVMDRRLLSDDTALAAIRASQHAQLGQIAMLESDQPQQPQQSAEIALPAGSVLSAAEMQRQDAASDAAYKILLGILANAPPAEAPLAAQAREQIVWIVGFFEGRLRADRAVALIERFLKDRSSDPARITLVYRAINDRLVWAGHRQPTDRLNKAWIDARHELFESARASIDQFVQAHVAHKDWIQQARLLRVESYDREAALASAISPVRAAGLLLQSAEALVELFQSMPDHPAAEHFAVRLNAIADRLVALHQEEQAIYILSQIPRHFPTHAQALPAVLRQAELHASNLSNPLRAVETYEEYLGLAGDNEAIRAQIFSIAQQLAAKQRYLEALHVFGVFVDSFPTDPRAPEALRSIGQTHQANDVWTDAIRAYQRILDEYPGVPLIPQVKLAVAECQIHLSQWKLARKLYEEYLQQFPNDGQAELAKQRIEILKNLDRYQTLLADQQVQRNKDDAQFQIASIVVEKLGNPAKAVMEFRKVVSEYPKSSQADDAQLEIGKALLALGRLDDARTELARVPRDFPGSPLADDALYLVGQSYERDAAKLAAVTGEKAREEAFERGQRGAYQVFNEKLQKQEKEFSARRDELKKAGQQSQIDLDEAANAFRLGGANLESLGAASRQAASQAETESALQVANRQDRINEAYRQAVASYARAASDYPLGDMTDEALLRMAQIYDTELKDRIAAMETYQKVVKFFPGTPVAEDAAWKVASAYEQEGKFNEAAAAYREFIRNYPASPKVGDAQFALAEVLEQLGRWVEAMDAYETFRQKFTAHPKSQLAQEQINWIKAYRK